jgi:hypothetical protein
MAPPYVGAMAIFPRPVSPKSAASDLRDMFSPERPHRWSILALSMTLTGLLLWGFVIDSRKPPKEREITYIESWMSDRRDSDIIREQLEDIARYEAALESKQGEFQRLADGLGIEWREDAEKNKVQREAVLLAVRQRLEKRLAESLEREGGSASAAAKAP